MLDSKILEQNMNPTEEKEIKRPLHHYIRNPRWRLVLVSVCGLAFIFGLIFIFSPHAFTFSQELGIGLASLSVPTIIEEFSKAWERRDHEIEMNIEHRERKTEVKGLQDALGEANESLKNLKKESYKTNVELEKAKEEALEIKQRDAAILGYCTTSKALGYSSTSYEPAMRSACNRLGIDQRYLDDFLRIHETYQGQKATEETSPKDDFQSLKSFVEVIEASLTITGLKSIYEITGNANTVNIAARRFANEIIEGRLSTDQNKFVDRYVNKIDQFRNDYEFAKPLFAKKLIENFDNLVGKLVEIKNVMIQIPLTDTPEKINELAQIILKKTDELTKLIEDLG